MHDSSPQDGPSQTLAQTGPPPHGLAADLQWDAPVQDWTPEQHTFLEECRVFSIGLARKAGALALALQHGTRVGRKADHSVVTEADKEVQYLMRDAILERFPTHKVLGEEELEGDALHTFEALYQAAQEGLWVVDPIDGTDSYVREIPSWSICLGLSLGGVPVLGVVYVPATQEMFCAVKGGPATRNGESIQVAHPGPLHHESMLLITSTAHRYTELNFPGKIRSYGSTAAHICYVATGRVDAAILGGMRVWDVFAPGVILEAAGGGLYQIDGTPHSVMEMLAEGSRTPVLVAGHSGIVEPVLSTLRPKYRRR